MSCIAVPRIPLADVPGLNILLGDITIDPPDLNSKLCCEVNLIIPPIPIPIGSIIMGLLADPTGSGVSTLTTAVGIINEAIEQINAIIALIDFDCPLD
jgi:hypothetical protein